MWLTALLIGFAGSVHCLGMCSPLVLAVTGLRPSAIFNRLIYNAGRITTYGLAGATVSGIGMMLPLHRYQNAVSIALGIALITVGLSGLSTLRVPLVHSVIHRLTTAIKQRFSTFLSNKSYVSMFIMGSLNGMLPCGLTLFALTACLALQGPIDGFNFMVLFGAGTLPVMLGLTGALPLLIKRLNWIMWWRLCV